MTIADLQEIERYHNDTAVQQLELASGLADTSAEQFRALAAQHLKRAERLRELIQAFQSLRDLFNRP